MWRRALTAVVLAATRGRRYFVGAASLCGDACRRIAELEFGSYKYMILMVSLSAIGWPAFSLR